MVRGGRDLTMPDGKGARERKLSTSRLARGLQLSGSVLGAAGRLGLGAVRRVLVAGEELARHRAEDDRAAASSLAGSMGRLKGAAMKLGQMLSYVDANVPEPMREALATLQSQAPAMDPETISGIIQADLGAPPEQLFAAWERQPFAAASIGQVHRARLHGGEEVAVKVQYPAIRDAVSADLKNAGMVQAMGRLVVRAAGSSEVVEEIRRRLLEECDYLREAANQKRFKALFAADPRVRIPGVVDRYSSERVLTSTFEQGIDFKTFNATADQRRKNAAAEIIWDVAFTSLFRHLFFNCDPHPGNYLFDGDQVVFLDFGCVRPFEPAFVRDWKGMIRAVLERDRDGFEDRVLKVGLVGNRAGFDFDYHFKMLQYLYRPMLHPGPYRFTEEYIKRSFHVLLANNPNRFKLRLPPELVFVNRLQWGLYSLLATMNAEVDWRRLTLRVLYEEGEKLPEPYVQPEED